MRRFEHAYPSHRDRLGTTHARVAVVEDGVPNVIPDRLGRRTTPTIVAVAAKAGLLVGHDARGQAITSPEGTVYAAKRLIGRKWNSPAVAAALETCPYKPDRGPHHDVRVDLCRRVYSLPEISAIVLR